MKPIYIMCIVFAVILFVVLIMCIDINHHKKFVLHHSIQYSQLQSINAQYKFYDINFNKIEHDFDHDVNFSNVSCTDYLIGYMSEHMDQINKILSYTAFNRKRYLMYKEDLKKIDKIINFDKTPKLLSTKRLLKYQNNLFNKSLLRPILYFDVMVILSYHDMGGNYKGRKVECIKEEQVLKYFKGLNDRNGYYYNNSSIWDALTRYERGKVSLKLRFAIYERDNYRCKCCGKLGYKTDLEIDHIIPISKGGKSTPDNLQTLCHRCNKAKGSDIEY